MKGNNNNQKVEYSLIEVGEEIRGEEGTSQLPLVHTFQELQQQINENRTSALHQLASKGDCDNIASILENMKPLDKEQALLLADGNGFTPLHRLAQRAGDTQSLDEIRIVDKFFSDLSPKQVDDIISQTNTHNSNALHVGARNNNIILESLIERVSVERKADLIESRTTHGHTPLHLAGKSGSTGAADVLLANKADPTARRKGPGLYQLLKGKTAAGLAAQKGHRGLEGTLRVAKSSWVERTQVVEQDNSREIIRHSETSL